MRKLWRQKVSIFCEMLLGRCLHLYNDFFLCGENLKYFISFEVQTTNCFIASVVVTSDKLIAVADDTCEQLIASVNDTGRP